MSAANIQIFTVEENPMNPDQTAPEEESDLDQAT